MNRYHCTRFNELIPSDTPESIYHADIFKINHNVWMIMGCGKTTAARLATGKVASLQLAEDAVAILRKNDSLFGRYDAGAHNPFHPDLHKLFKLDAIAYCLDEKQSKILFDDNNLTREIVNAGADTLSTLCSIYSYPAYFAPQFFNVSELVYLADAHRMRRNFFEISSNITSTKFLIVPFMDEVQRKSELYIHYKF
jgi:hypothetical protein